MAPEANDEYLLYQTLLGAWPVGFYSDGVHADFVRRIQEYMQKAIHEAKVHTSWINPNASYDEAIPRFIARILDRRKNRRFLDDFCAFQERISHYGYFNSLSQTLLKCASPGVPDIYQGTELWDFSLVDPDNRRPVDYHLRRRLMHELQDQIDRAGPHLAVLARQLTQAKEDGRIKLHVTRRALRCRRDHPGLFTTGEYLPAEADGSQEEHVCAFVRHHGPHWAIAAAPRLLTRLTPHTADLPLGEHVWGDTVLLLPGVGPGQCCRNIFTNELLTTTAWHEQGSLRLAEVFANFPVALLLGQP
jgi:(1->4)-alpha-D-glucan 1-alpha-D-glucosylmutase